MRVTQFIIIAGPGVHPALAASRDRLLAHMLAEFPDYTFNLVTPNAGDGDLEDDTLLVLPVVGSVGDNGSPLAERPPHNVMVAIEERLRAFNPARTN